jgi:deazaflavin-dependent oxidoreductase (nitroreductase family)
MTTTIPSTTRYLRPGWVTTHLMNRAIRRLVRLGVGPWGARELRVVGRSSGQVRTTVVNVLSLDGADHLVAPRGHTQWVRNVRAAGGAEVRLGRHVTPVRAVELADGEKLPVLRAYLARWAFEVGQFFEGITADSSDAELAAIAPDFPVFRLEAVAAA